MFYFYEMGFVFYVIEMHFCKVAAMQTKRGSSSRLWVLLIKGFSWANYASMSYLVGPPQIDIGFSGDKRTYSAASMSELSYYVDARKLI